MMSKKMIAMLTALVMVLGCTGALAENTKHERVYVVAGADGTVKSITDSVRLENADGLDELTDRTMLTGIQNVSGNEAFTLEGEMLTWKADGKNVIYQGTSDKAPAVLPVVTLTLDGEKISAAGLKEKTGEAVLTVTYRTEEQAPALVLSVLPLPEEGVSDLKAENAAVFTEAGRSVLVGWAVPNMDDSLQLPASFSASFHADHADLGWMMTFCSSDPLEAACHEIDARVGNGDPESLLKEVTALLAALKDGTDLPGTEGKTKEIADKINELNKGLNALDAGAVTLADGAKQVFDGATALNTGLSTLKKNNEALNNGAEQIFAVILNTANEQIAASGLADAGVTVPALTAKNYTEVLDGVIAQLDPGTLKAASAAAQMNNEGIPARAAAALEQLTALKEQLDQVNTFVTGLKDYTDGVAQASDGAATLSAGAMLVSAGASTLQETGTKTLKDSIFSAEKGAAEKLLPLLEKDLTGALNAWKTTKNHLTDTGYDLKPEGMDEETVYIIRTDLK